MSTSLSANRRHADEVQPFHAPVSLFDDLQKVLVDLIELQVQGKQAHWNLVGTNFRDLHLQLDGIVDAAREASDTIAERMRALDAVSRWALGHGRGNKNRPRHTPRACSVSPKRSISLPIGSMRSWTRCAPCTTRSTRPIPRPLTLLHAIIDALEKEAWLVKSENGAA